MMKGWTRRYTAVDGRLLGVFRIVLGAVVLGDLLRRWPEARVDPVARTALEGRPPGDALVSFEVYWVTHDSPPPGATAARNTRREMLTRGP